MFSAGGITVIFVGYTYSVIKLLMQIDRRTSYDYCIAAMLRAGISARAEISTQDYDVYTRKIRVTHSGQLSVAQYTSHRINLGWDRDVKHWFIILM